MLAGLRPRAQLPKVPPSRSAGSQAQCDERGAGMAAPGDPRPPAAAAPRPRSLLAAAGAVRALQCVRKCCQSKAGGRTGLRNAEEEEVGTGRGDLGPLVLIQSRQKPPFQHDTSISFRNSSVCVSLEFESSCQAPRDPIPAAAREPKARVQDTVRARSLIHLPRYPKELFITCL